MPDQLTARGSRAVADLGGHRAGQLGHLGQRHRGQVPALPGQLDHPVPLGRAVPPRAARPAGSRRAAACRAGGGGAKVGGEPVPFLAQPGAVGFQGARSGPQRLPGACPARCAASSRTCSSCGPQPAGLPFRPGADLIAFPGRIGQGLGDGLPRRRPVPGQVRRARSASAARARSASPRAASAWAAACPTASSRWPMAAVILLVGCLPDRLQLGHVPGAKARRHRAVGHHPGPEPAQRARGIEHQPQQPQRHPARQGQRGRPVIGQRLTAVACPGQHPGPDHADQRVRGQRVDPGGHHPDRQVPPSVPGRQRVHRQRDPDARHVQRPRPHRPPAVQGQRHAQRGEDHRADVRDARLQRGHPGRLLDPPRPSCTAPAS